MTVNSKAIVVVFFDKFFGRCVTQCFFKFSFGVKSKSINLTISPEEKRISCPEAVVSFDEVDIFEFQVILLFFNTHIFLVKLIEWLSETGYYQLRLLIIPIFCSLFDSSKAGFLSAGRT